MRARGRVGIVMVAAVLMTAAACSGDDGGSNDTTVAPSTTSVDVAPTDAPDDTGAPDDTEAPATGDPTFTIGYLGPGAGLLSAVSIGQERGLTLAVDEINAAGGVLGGPIASVRADENADEALETTVDGLVAQGTRVLVGPVSSATAANLLPILTEQNLLACSASATSTSLTAAADTSIPPTFVRTALRDDHFATILADGLMAPDADGAVLQRVMIVARDDVYGNDLTAGLAAELTARGAEVTTDTYPSRRVQFPEESANVAATNPDRVVLIAFDEGPRLVADIVGAGFPVDRIVGLNGLLVPRIAEQAFPSDPSQANGLTVIGSTGDRALINRLQQVPASQDQIVYGPQMYDCVITLALAAIVSGSVEPAAIAAQVGPVTAGGRICSTFLHCVQLLDAGEDIDYDGTTGRIALDGAGDISSARVTTGRVIDGQLQSVGSQEVDLVALRQHEVFASAVFVAQLQQALKVLGYYDGDITGIYDEATTAAVTALQRDLGLPETGVYDEATDAALREALGGRVSTLGTSIAALQQALTDLGYYTGPIDGRYSSEFTAAVQAFQTDLGVPATGIVDAATLQAIYARGVDTGVASVPTTTTTTTTEPPVTEPPATDPPATDAPATAPPATEAPVTEPATTTPTTIPEPPPTTIPEPDDLYDVLLADGRFKTLALIVKTAGYGPELSHPGPLTLFAPTDGAFELLEPDDVAELTSVSAKANDFMLDLVGQGLLNPLVAGDFTTFRPTTVSIAGGPDVFTFDGAEVSDGPIVAGNGVAYALSQVPTFP